MLEYLAILLPSKGEQMTQKIVSGITFVEPSMIVDVYYKIHQELWDNCFPRGERCFAIIWQSKD